MEYEVQFNDLTLLEGNGQYNDVKELMLKPTKSGAVEDIVVEEWMIESTVLIQSEFGFASFICHFYHDGKVLIANYIPTINDIHNPDIRCLSHWLQEFGWNRPVPLQSVIEDWKDFWHHQWDTFIIDSDYFDKHFGKRKNVVFEEQEESEEEVGEKTESNPIWDDE